MTGAVWGASLTAWLHGSGHPAAAVVEALRSVLEQRESFLDIVCIVDVDVAEEMERLAVSLPGGARANVQPVDLGDDAGVLNALLAEAAGDFVVWLEASSVLVRGAAQGIRDALGRFDVDLFYSDSTRTHQGGRHSEVIRRPTFSPIRLRSQDYLGDLRGFRVERMRQLGGFRAGLGGAHAYDLALRFATVGAEVVEIPEPLTSARGDSVRLGDNHRRAAEDHLSTLGIAGAVTRQSDRALRVDYALDGRPLVSIIIPTRGGRAEIRGQDRTLVVDAVKGILERSTYTNLEFVVVADDETPQRVIDELVEVGGPRMRLVRWSESFNFSSKMNRGATYARGDYLLLLNDDVELITPDWIEVMLGLAQQSEVGLVGTMLYFEDDTVQHGGHLYNGGWAGHIALGWPSSKDDSLGSMGVDREVSGVTAACAMIPTDLYWSIGGFSPLFAGNYNDVDFALKIRTAGRSIVWTPHARLYHFESKTREATVSSSELETLRRLWATRILFDPYWP